MIHARHHNSALAPAAMMQLLLHCSGVDGDVTREELSTIHGIMKSEFAMDETWVLNQASAYRQKAAMSTRQDLAYLRFLLHRIEGVSSELLLWHCAQVTVSDGEICLAESIFMERLSELLFENSETAQLLQRLAWQHHKKTNNSSPY